MVSHADDGKLDISAACCPHIGTSNMTVDPRTCAQTPIEVPPTTDTGFMTIQTSVCTGHVRVAEMSPDLRFPLSDA